MSVAFDEIFIWMRDRVLERRSAPHRPSCWWTGTRTCRRPPRSCACPAPVPSAAWIAGDRLRPPQKAPPAPATTRPDRSTPRFCRPVDPITLTWI